MGNSVSDLHESRLLQAVSDARRVITTLLLFAIAIVGAGAIRINQTNAIKTDLMLYNKNLPISWEPIESFYNRSSYLLIDFASENSPPWSRSFMIITIYLVALDSIKPSSTLTKTIDRYSETGKMLHRYNSDIRTIATAQRRNLSFRQLSIPELRALERIVSHKLTSNQAATLKEAPQTAAMLLSLSQELQKAIPQKNDLRSQILYLKKPESRATLQDIADGRKWSDASTKFLSEDLYYINAKMNAENFALLRKSINALPGTTIAAAEARQDELTSQQAALDRDAGLSLPLLGIRVAAAHVTLAAGVINAVLVGTICLLLMRARIELMEFKKVRNTDGRDLYLVMVRDVALGHRKLLRGTALICTLAAPSIAALAFFGEDASRLAALLIMCLTLLVVFALSCFVLWQSVQLSHLASEAVLTPDLRGHDINY